MDSFCPAGCLASWQGGRAAPQRTCVTCLQRWTPSSPPWPSSTSLTKSCSDLSCTDERAGFICSGRNIHAIFDITVFLKLCFSCFRPPCWAASMNSALVICPFTERRERNGSINQRLAWWRNLLNEIDKRENLCVLITYFSQLNERIYQRNSQKKRMENNLLLLHYNFRHDGVPLQHITAWLRLITSSR